MEQNASTGRPFTVVDRRFSATADRPEQDGEETPRKPSYVEQLERDLEERDRRLQETLAQHRHAVAEFESARARLSRDVAREVETQRRSIIVDLLEVLDNLDRGLDAAGTANGPEALRHGVSLVRDQFVAKLAAMGVQKVTSLEQPFDPSRHEAISVVPVEDTARGGLVVGVIREAYLIGDEVLRPAMVAVGRAAASAEAGPTAAASVTEAAEPGGEASSAGDDHEEPRAG